MSQPAQKRTVAVHPSATEERTGRFAIDDSIRGTVLPPRGDDADLVSLEDVGAILEVEPEHAARAVNPTPPSRGIASGVFSMHPQPAPAAPPPVPLDVRPPRESERARLEIEDLSLRPGNPYAASSLVPPARQPVSVTKAMAIVSVIALSAVGVWTLVQSLTAEPPTQAPTWSIGQPPGPAPAAAAHAPAATVLAARETPQPDALPSVVVPQPPQASRAAKPEEPSVPSGDSAPFVPTQPAVENPATIARAEPTSVTVAAPEAAAVELPAETTPEDAAAALAALPQTPTREDVVAGFEAVQDALVQCAAGKQGVAEIEATIANSGRISHALIGGKFTGTAEGSCMARVVRTARFPQFRQPTLKVSYPVAL